MPIVLGQNSTCLSCAHATERTDLLVLWCKTHNRVTPSWQVCDDYSPKYNADAAKADIDGR